MGKSYFCSGCGSPLHLQDGFNDYDGTWVCRICSRENNLSDSSDSFFKEISIETDGSEKEVKTTFTKKLTQVIEDESYKEKVNNFVNDNKEKMKESVPKQKKDWIRFFILIVLVILCVIALYFVLQFRKLTSVGIASEHLSRYTYVQVVEKLEEQGFSNITLIPIYDLTVDDLKNDYKVTDMKIGDVSEFTSTKKFLCDEKVVITYHTLEEISIGISYRDASKYNYEDLVKVLEKKGFINIEVQPIHDLTFGWFVKDGDVDSMLINDSTKYDSDTKVRPDARIVINYHTFKE